MLSPSSPAIAEMKLVLPLPGGPWNRYDLLHGIPRSAYHCSLCPKLTTSARPSSACPARSTTDPNGLVGLELPLRQPPYWSGTYTSVRSASLLAASATASWISCSANAREAKKAVSFSVSLMDPLPDDAPKSALSLSSLSSFPLNRNQ